MTFIAPPLPTAVTTDPGNYQWRASEPGGEAHAFPPVEDGRLPGRCACGRRRWTVAFGHVGGSMSRECVAKLRDDLRAIIVALAAAGIHIETSRYDGYERRPGFAVADYDTPMGAGEAVEASRG
jgi:hypothetical protein